MTMLKLCILSVLLYLACCVVDTSVQSHQTYSCRDSEVSLEITRGYQWGKHLVRNVQLETAISADVYFFGGYVELSFKKIVIDDLCKVSRCHSCNGTKAFEKEYTSDHLKSMHVHKHLSYPCPTCLGLGIVVDGGQRCQPYRTVHVTERFLIPAGLFVNDIATLPKEGNEIYENGEKVTGSLMVSISNIYSEKADIVIKSHCVHMTVLITPIEALYGFSRQLNVTDYFQTSSVTVLDAADTDSKVDVIKDRMNGTVLVLDRSGLVTLAPMEITLKSFVVFPAAESNNETNTKSIGKSQDLLIEFQLYSAETMQQRFLDQHRCIRATTVSSLCPPNAHDTADVINLDGGATISNPCEVALFQEYVYNITVRGDEVLLCQNELILTTNESDTTTTAANQSSSMNGDVSDRFDAEYANSIGGKWNEMTAKDQLIRRMLYILKSRQGA